MSEIKGKLLSKEYTYDFDKDGGVIGNIVLSDKAGYKNLPAGALVMDVHSKVETEVTSGGAGTLSAGDNSDFDGYITAQAIADLEANDAAKGAGALVPSSAGGQFSVSIATADLTAGKVRYVVSYYLPGQQND